MTTSAVTTFDLPAIEAVLAMESGYVLDFSNRTFAMFFAELGVDIDADYPEGSKANRLREFLRSADASLAAKVLEALLERRGPRDGDEELTHLVRYKNILSRLAGSRVALSPAPLDVDVLSLTYISELERKIEQRLGAADLEGAITASRTLVESVLVALEERITGTRQDHKRDLQGQFTVVRKLLRIDEERADLDDNFKTMIKGLVQVINGLAPLRNKMGDGHARERKPALHHARFVANAAKTIASFLVESYVYQHERGLLAVPEPQKNPG